VASDFSLCIFLFFSFFLFIFFLGFSLLGYRLSLEKEEGGGRYLSYKEFLVEFGTFRVGIIQINDPMNNPRIFKMSIKGEPTFPNKGKT
jgi:hypothetical protein